MAESSMKTLGAGLLLAGSTKPTIIQSIESDINDLRDELALGQRIVTAAEHDRWKDIHEEISLDVQCSAEEIIVYLKGVIPNELFQLRDPKCKLKPTDRDTQAIKVIILAGFVIRMKLNEIEKGLKIDENHMEISRIVFLHGAFHDIIDLIHDIL